VPNSIPNAAQISPFIIDLLAKLATAVKPNNANQKYSGGPKARAKRANIGARVNNAIALNIPPTIEDNIAILMALVDSPFRVN